jgi:hypothetical protein
MMGKVFLHPNGSSGMSRFPSNSKTSFDGLKILAKHRKLAEKYQKKIPIDSFLKALSETVEI